MKYNVPNMAEFVGSRSGFTGGVAVVLGSGLGGFTEKIETPTVIPYSAIPNYPLPTVVGHSGEFIIGNYQDVPLLAAKGRFHYYEGHGIDTVTLPIKLFNNLGVKYIIITNAAGSIKISIPPGSLMAIEGYIDATYRENSESPKIENNISLQLLDSVKKASRQTKVKLDSGIYCWTQGPGYETPAEVKYLRSIGTDAVGMSTVPELQAADKLGIGAIGISTITNYAAGILDQPLTHNEVIETANRTKDDFTKLIGASIENIGALL